MGGLRRREALTELQAVIDRARDFQKRGVVGPEAVMNHCDRGRLGAVASGPITLRKKSLEVLEVPCCQKSYISYNPTASEAASGPTTLRRNR